MADISRTDFEFLNFMDMMATDTVRMARAYLANSDPAERLAAVADIARSAVEGHSALSEQIQSMLENATPPDAQSHPADPGDPEMMD